MQIRQLRGRFKENKRHHHMFFIDSIKTFHKNPRKIVVGFSKERDVSNILNETTYTLMFIYYFYHSLLSKEE